MSVSHCCLVWCRSTLEVVQRVKGGGGGPTWVDRVEWHLHGISHIPPTYACAAFYMGNKYLNIELPAGGGWSRDVPCWAHPTCELRVSSPGTCLEHGCGLACPGFPSMHSKLALVSTRPSNLLASNNTLFLTCHARHAMPSRPFHAYIHSMQGDEPKEPSKPHTAPPPGGGFEGLEPREWLPGLEDFENNLERKEKKLPIPDADQSAEPAGVSRVYTLHYTRTTFGPARAFSMHCNVRHFSRRQDKPPPPLPSPDLDSE